MVDNVAKTVNESWKAVFEMNVFEFLNILCYARDKAEFERQQIQKWAKKN